MQYVANNASRVIIRAVGDLDFNSLNQQRFETDTGNKDDNSGVDEEVIRNTLEQGPKQGSKQLKTSIPPLQKTEVQIEDYRPSVSADGIWTISETDISKKSVFPPIGPLISMHCSFLLSQRMACRRLRSFRLWRRGSNLFRIPRSSPGGARG